MQNEYCPALVWASQRQIRPRRLNRDGKRQVALRARAYLITSEAGVPHPDASLSRVIIEFEGNPELMPWNSSKSDVIASRPAFAQIRPLIIQLVKHFSKLSRRLKNDWDGEVFKYKRGKPAVIDPAEIESGKKITLPKLPRTRSPSAMVDLKTRNKGIIDNQPWTLGLVEAMDAMFAFAVSTSTATNSILPPATREVNIPINTTASSGLSESDWCSSRNKSGRTHA